MSKVKTDTYNYIFSELLPVEVGDQINDDSSLIKSGLLDSMSVLMLVDYLEKTHSIIFEATEVVADHLDTLNKIEAVILKKK